MISDAMAEALNDQTNAELYSSYLYLAMSAHFTHAGLKGGANWFYVQAREEMLHVQKFYDYVLSQGKRVVLKAIDAPPAEFGTPVEVFQHALEHEQNVTARINDLVAIAVAENDRATEVFLHWFVTEQVEEEESAKDVIDKLRLAGEVGPGLFMIDTELSTRVFVPPAGP